MVVNKRKKVVKYRGHTTHGCGSRKKRRGAGSRGGRGRAGTGKRAGQKKAGMAPQLGSLLKSGFFRFGSQKKNLNVINLGDFTLSKVEKWVAEGKAVKEGTFYVIDLTKLNYGKLLGQGETNLKLKLKIGKFSVSAEEKIKSAGGEIISEDLSEATKN